MLSTHMLFQLCKSFYYQNQIASSIDKIGHHISYNKGNTLGKAS